MDAAAPDGAALAILGGVSLVALAGALRLFRRARHRFLEEL
jgi:hypothetical protein